MELNQHWYSLDKAAQKYGLEKREIEEWVEEGLLRSETEGTKVTSVHADDLELLVHKKAGI